MTTYKGRTVITSGVTSIDEGNILDVLLKGYSVHSMNRSQIEYLFDYYKGNQPILQRTKTVRPEICNKIVENRANEIVSFKVGYLCGEPIQYVGRHVEGNVSDDIATLNEMMFSEDKSSKDQELVEWQMICGTAYRLALPKKVVDVDDAPFEIITLDPRNAFVVYSTEIHSRPLMGVTYWTDEHNTNHFSVYTDSTFYNVEGDHIVSSVPHLLGTIPIFEYPANNARLGSFEIVLPLLDAINSVESNRMDGIEQTVQAFMKFINCDFKLEDLDLLKERGAIKISSTDGLNADVDMVKTDLDQSQTQTFKEDLYNAILTICGMPNRNGGGSTSDTGAAVLLRDGWSLAEARAKDSEHMFKKSEKQMLKLVLSICRAKSSINLYLKDIDMRFTRRNYDNIQSKAQVLVEMLSCDKIHPQLAFQGCGMFPDSETAYLQSMQWWEQQKKEALEELNALSGDDHDENDVSVQG